MQCSKKWFNYLIQYHIMQSHPKTKICVFYHHHHRTSTSITTMAPPHIQLQLFVSGCFCQKNWGLKVTGEKPENNNLMLIRNNMIVKGWSSVLNKVMGSVETDHIKASTETAVISRARKPFYKFVSNFRDRKGLRLTNTQYWCTTFVARTRFRVVELGEIRNKHICFIFQAIYDAFK